MDFCAFDLLKRPLNSYRPKTINRLWKAVEEEWAKLSILIL